MEIKRKRMNILFCLSGCSSVGLGLGSDLGLAVIV